MGNGVYIGRLWYTYPVNGLRAGDFTGTAVADSFVIKNGKLAEPLRPNTLRINENVMNVLNNVIGVTKRASPSSSGPPTRSSYAPEVAVKNVHLDAIGEYMEAL